MCNAANHPYSCDCGFGGDTGGGGRRWSSLSNFATHYAPPSFGWARDNGGTVASYVNANAYCPVCGASVYFYRSPHNGRVFFDQLGWPWPKHPCTDNLQQPRSATHFAVAERIKPKTQWQGEGWTPVLSACISKDAKRIGVRGDCGAQFVDLVLPVGATLDRETPILIRTVSSHLFEITFLSSDQFSTRAAITVAFDRRLAPVGDDVLRLAAQNDPTAQYTLARFLLWELDDVSGARPYLEAAAARGDIEAAIDLLALALFEF